MKTVRIFLGIIIVLLAGYFLGPKMAAPVLNADLPVVTGDIGEYITHLEAAENVRKDNEAKIIWANDTDHTQTAYVLLYLHGFSASRMEGFPVNENFSKRYRCNAYLARLAAHGLDTENPLIDMTPYRLYESAKQALVIAGRLGQKVVIMGTSTGATLALQLAADFPKMVYGLILYSPNVKIKQKASVLLSKPWGLQIARLNFGGKFRVITNDPADPTCKYWYCKYRAEGVVFLQQLLDVTMNQNVFANVRCPLFLGYYFKDEQHQDETVEVKAGLKMFSQVGTPESQKRAQAFPDAGSHVIASDLTSKSVAEVEKATWKFAEEILLMKPE